MDAAMQDVPRSGTTLRRDSRTARYACSRMWLVQNCTRRLACRRGSNSMSVSYFFDGMALSTSAMQMPHTEVHHQTAARQASSAF